MVRTSLFSAFLAVLLLASCEKEYIQGNATTLNMNFAATFGTDALVVGEVYPYGAKAKVTFEGINAFFGNATLIPVKEGDGVTDLFTIKNMDFSFATKAEAEAGINLVKPGVEALDYAGISLGIGVPGDLNKKKPSSFGGGHPLANAERYSKPWGSYIFMQIQGKIDTDGNGTWDGNFNYLTGTNGLYNEKLLSKKLIVTKDQVFQLPVRLDVKKLFLSDGTVCDTNQDGYIDLESCNSTASDPALVLGKKIASNVLKALTIK